MKATLKDVAAAADVGLSTASYVLNGTGQHKVSPETRERIFAAARRLNYTPNAIARGLRSGKSYLIGVVLPGIDYSFMPEIIAGIDHELETANYNMILCTFNKLEELPQKIMLLKQKQIDGIILKVWDDRVLELIGGICGRNFPGVLVTMADRAVFPGVLADPEQLGFTALDYLYKLNHRKIVIINRGRAEAWCHAIHKHIDHFSGVSIREINRNSPGWEREIFDHVGDFSAVLACDPVAAELIHEAALRKVRIPEDFSVLGVDGLDIGAYTIPALTSVAQPREGQGVAAARLLLQWLKSGKRPAGVKLQSDLCIRKSVGAAKKICQN